MNCLDCLVDDQLGVPAVAVCTVCGVAVCQQQVVLTGRRLLRSGPLFRQDPVDPPARTAGCRPCQVATGATKQTPGTMHLPGRHTGAKDP